jgi:hypothetical protein
MRGLLTRLVRLLARWLHGIAARLERYARPALAPAALDALEHRFPGAPEHWLRDIAEHVDRFEALPADAAVRAEQEPEERASVLTAPVQRSPAAPARRPRPELRIAPQRDARRASAPPKSAAHPTRPALRWFSAAVPMRQMAEAGATPHRRAVPAPVGAVSTPAPRRWLDWIGRMASNRAAQPVEPLPARDHELSPGTGAAEQQAERIFALPTAVPQHRSPAAIAVGETNDRTPLDWPEPPPSPSPAALRFETGGAVRPVQSWTPAVQGCWPALPDTGHTIGDAEPAVRPLHDFNREQMAGLWSG